MAPAHATRPRWHLARTGKSCTAAGDILTRRSRLESADTRPWIWTADAVCSSHRISDERRLRVTDQHGPAVIDAGNAIRRSSDSFNRPTPWLTIYSGRKRALNRWPALTYGRVNRSQHPAEFLNFSGWPKSLPELIAKVAESRPCAARAYFSSARVDRGEKLDPAGEADFGPFENFFRPAHVTVDGRFGQCGDGTGGQATRGTR